MKDVLLLVGAGQIGMAIARRVGINHKILIGDKNFDNAIVIADNLKGAGFDTVATEIDIADKNSIVTFIEKGQSYGEIDLLINAAGVSPSQASNETIMPALTAEEDRLLATTPIDQLLTLDLLQTDKVKDSLHAYQLAKRGNGS